MQNREAKKLWKKKRKKQKEQMRNYTFVISIDDDSVQLYSA